MRRDASRARVDVAGRGEARIELRRNVDLAIA